MTVQRKEWCHNNRRPTDSGFFAKDNTPLVTNSEKYVWIPNRFTQECQQPGKGYPPLPGCVGCDHLRRYDE